MGHISPAIEFFPRWDGKPILSRSHSITAVEQRHRYATYVVHHCFHCNLQSIQRATGRQCSIAQLMKFSLSSFLWYSFISLSSLLLSGSQ